MFDDVFDALHFELGVCCDEADWDELGAGGAGSGFSALRCEYRQGRVGVFRCAHVRFFTLGWGWSSGAGESEEEGLVSDAMASPLARFLLL